MENLINNMERVVKKEAYPNGYVPKIHYWCSELHKNLICKEPDMRSVQYCLDKLQYFTNREKNRKQENIYQNVSF